MERTKNITPESIARLLEEEKAIIQGLLSNTFEQQSLNAFLTSPVGESFYKQCDLTAAQGLLANDGSPLEINIWCQDRLINMAPGSRYRFHADPTGQMAQAHQVDAILYGERHRDGLLVALRHKHLPPARVAKLSSLSALTRRQRRSTPQCRGTSQH